MKTGRNDPCPCGSGKKYKQCCLNKQADGMPLSQKLIAALIGIIVVGGLIIGISTMTGEDHSGLGPGEGRVWSDEHQHWH